MERKLNYIWPRATPSRDIYISISEEFSYHNVYFALNNYKCGNDGNLCK